MSNDRYQHVVLNQNVRVTQAIQALAEHEAWPTFMSWFFDQCLKPDIDLTNPDPNKGLAQSARLNLFIALTNKLNERIQEN